jgi:glycosyltransferase involved in cell wall biosynthesis
VDVNSFQPRPKEEAAIGLSRLADKLGSGETAAWGGEIGAGEALRKLDPRRDRIVSYVGKLIVSKGVDLLLAAWPLVVAHVATARLVVVGFGAYRDALARFVAALGRRDLETLHKMAARGRELEGGPPGKLTHLSAFLESASAEWLGAAPPWGRSHSLHRTD